MKLEVIATNLRDVVDADLCKVDRIELSPSMSELGITPSYGLIREAVRTTDIPINVIIRPHNQSFHYDEYDLKTMIADIEMAKKLGANGIVVGALTPEKTVDEAALERLLKAADSLDVTFHRAFDFARDQFEAFDTLKKYNEVTSILTAGGAKDALDAVNDINQLIQKTEDTHLELIICRGLRLNNLRSFLNKVKRIDAIHFGTGIRIDDSYNNLFDQEKIQKIKQILNS